MYGAWALPRISPRLWFSMTIVNTVPPFQAGATTPELFVTGSHATFVLPGVVAQPERASAATATLRQEEKKRFVMRGDLALDLVMASAPDVQGRHRAPGPL